MNETLNQTVFLAKASALDTAKGACAIIGPILWGHNGPPLSRVVVVVVVVDIDAQAACDHACDSGGVLLATPGEWQCGGLQWRSNGPNIFQMLLVYRRGAFSRFLFFQFKPISL